jgi:glycosyltransferase involved in cell wall biosynthesis
MTPRPLLSVIAPTIGRDTLPRMLQSVRDQAPAPVCELIVVGDTCGNDFVRSLEPVPALCAEYQARYLEHDAGAHMVGQPQRQAGMAAATGRWVGFCQDDDVWVPGAWDAIRASLVRPPRCPRLFKVRTQWGFVVWDTGTVAEGHVDADCIVTPNDPRRLGRWGLRYCGDYDFIAETVDLWRGNVVWEPALIAHARPRRSQLWGNVG